MRPACGASSPVSCPISVVLPAPFGPMMAWSSPSGTARLISSEAVTPPKRLVIPLIASSGSGIARPQHPEARIDDTPDEKDYAEQQHEAEIVENNLVREIDEAAELAAAIDRQAIVGAIAVEADADIVDHLRERERDHDEVDAAGAQAECADDQR